MCSQLRYFDLKCVVLLPVMTACVTGLSWAFPVEPPVPVTKVESLSEFEDREKKNGWAAGDRPPLPDTQAAIVRVPGGLDALVKEQKVTLRYSWVVTSTKLIKKQSVEKLGVQFVQSDADESCFDIVSAKPPRQAQLDIEKAICKVIAGSNYTMKIEVDKGEEKLVATLQQRIQIFSDEKPPVLIATGYLRRYSDVVFVKKDVK